MSCKGGRGGSLCFATQDKIVLHGEGRGQTRERKSKTVKDIDQHSRGKKAKSVSASQPAGQSVSQSPGQPAGQAAGQQRPASQSVCQPACQAVTQPTSRARHPSIGIHVCRRTCIFFRFFLRSAIVHVIVVLGVQYGPDGKQTGIQSRSDKNPLGTNFNPRNIH